MLRRTRRKLVEQGLHTLSYFAVKRHTSSKHKTLVLAIYRYENAGTLAAIAEEVRLRGWELRLWALDRIHPALARYSSGCGGGFKFSLLNKLICGQSLSAFDWVVVTDDDVRFEYGSLATFLSIAQTSDMAIAQPAHSFASFSTHPITVCNPSAIARLTTFVEIGPLFAVSRSWFDRVFPFPEDKGMGWGLDIEWSDLQSDGARLGIVDWVALRHLRPGGIVYDTSGERVRMEGLLRDRGYRSLAEFQKTKATWRIWRGGPPWLDRRRTPPKA